MLHHIWHIHMDPSWAWLFQLFHDFFVMILGMAHQWISWKLRSAKSPPVASSGSHFLTRQRPGVFAFCWENCCPNSELPFKSIEPKVTKVVEHYNKRNTKHVSDVRKKNTVGCCLVTGHISSLRCCRELILPQFCCASFPEPKNQCPTHSLYRVFNRKGYQTWSTAWTFPNVIDNVSLLSPCFVIIQFDYCRLLLCPKSKNLALGICQFTWD